MSSENQAAHPTKIEGQRPALQAVDDASQFLYDLSQSEHILSEEVLMRVMHIKQFIAQEAGKQANTREQAETSKQADQPATILTNKDALRERLETMDEKIEALQRQLDTLSKGVLVIAEVQLAQVSEWAEEIVSLAKEEIVSAGGTRVD